MSPDGQFLYALLITNDHRAYFANPAATTSNAGGRIADTAANASDIVLVRINRETLVEVDRLTLVTGTLTRPRARMTQITPNGTHGVIPVRREGSVFLVDLTTMTIVDADEVTAGDQPFDVSASSTEPHMAGISPDGATIAVTYRGDSRGGPARNESVDLIDVASGTITPLAPGTTDAKLTDNKSAFLMFGPDGRLYYGRKATGAAFGLSIFDLVTPGEVELFADTLAATAVFRGGILTFFDQVGGLSRLDTATDTLIPFGAGGPTTQALTDTGFGHVGTLSPL